MKNNIVPFAFDESLIRVLTDENGEPLFVAKDVCKALEYSDASNPARLIAHVPEEWTEVKPIHIRSENGVGQMRDVLCLTEPGLYFFLARSDKPKALPFQKWLAGEVLPSIRKTGAYHAAPLAAPAAVFELPLTDEVLAVKPAFRLQLYSEARRTAFMAGGGPEMAKEYFLELCRMMAAKPVAASDTLTRFLDECLEECPGWRETFRDIRAACHRWWRDNDLGGPPGDKTLSLALESRFQRFKSNCSVFRHCRLRRGSGDRRQETGNRKQWLGESEHA